MLVFESDHSSTKRRG